MNVLSMCRERVARAARRLRGALFRELLGTDTRHHARPVAVAAYTNRRTTTR